MRLYSYSRCSAAAWARGVLRFKGLDAHPDERLSPESVRQAGDPLLALIRAYGAASDGDLGGCRHWLQLSAAVERDRRVE